VLVQAGATLSRALNDDYRGDALIRPGQAAIEIPYPCGPNITCFAKDRYRPVWL